MSPDENRIPVNRFPLFNLFVDILQCLWWHYLQAHFHSRLMQIKTHMNTDSNRKQSNGMNFNINWAQLYIIDTGGEMISAQRAPSSNSSEIQQNFYYLGQKGKKRTHNAKCVVKNIYLSGQLNGNKNNRLKRVKTHSWTPLWVCVWETHSTSCISFLLQHNQNRRDAAFPDWMCVHSAIRWLEHGASRHQTPFLQVETENI